MDLLATNRELIVSLVTVTIAILTAGGTAVRWYVDTTLKKRDQDRDAAQKDRDDKQKELDSGFSRLKDAFSAAQSIIKQQQESIEIMGHDINELRLEKANYHKEIEALRQQVDEYAARDARWWEWAAEVNELLRQAGIPAPTPSPELTPPTSPKSRKRPRL